MGLPWFLVSYVALVMESKAKGFGVGLKAMKDVKPDELADAINQCSVVICVMTTVGTDNGRFVDRLASK